MRSDVGSSICEGEPSAMLENRSLISRLISSMFSSSPFLAISSVGGGGVMSIGVKDEVQLVTTSAVCSRILTNVDFKTPTDLGFWGIWPGCGGTSYLDPPTSNRGHLVVIFWTNVSSSAVFQCILGSLCLSRTSPLGFPA